MRIKPQLLGRVIESLILITILFLSNRLAWYCFFILDDREYYCQYGNVLTDFIWWGVVTFGIILLLMRKGLLREYLIRWEVNWALIMFIAYALLSLIWTVNVDRSIHTVYILIAASLSAAGVATMYSREEIFKILLWAAGSIAVLSLLAVILVPKTAITQIDYLAGTWRGVFWHKNYLGSVMAFGNGLFLLSSLRGSAHPKALILSCIFYLLTLFLVIMSQSATGLIILILLNGICLAYFAWLKWGRVLKRTHYVWFAALSSLLIGSLLLNLGSLFSIIGKNPTLTGRVPVWRYLFQNVISKRPWLGYGLETVWYERNFQVAVAKAARWDVVVINAHNGYMDILIYLGWIGFIIFLSVIVQGVINALQDAFSAARSHNFLPVLILAYVLITNITISYFLEFESFHWVLMVLVLFMTSHSENTSIKSFTE
jgi:exopolysaccharide production protein ExoQ